MGYLALLALAVTLVTFASCKKTPWSGPTEETTEITDMSVADQVEAALNPNFTTVQEVLDFRLQQSEEASIDSAFEMIPQQILINVSSVVIKRNDFATKESIVKEYRANKAVYDNLPANSTKSTTNAPQDVDLSATDLGDKRNDDVFSTSYQYRTDTIKGKPVKVQIKTEESYVK